MSAELLPCPFCGGAPSLARCGFGTGRVVCMVCNSEGQYCQSHDAAIDAWNTRAPQAAPELSTASRPEAVVLAWLHEDDPSRVISDVQKAQALIDGGASASSVRPYAIALAARATPGLELTRYECQRLADLYFEHIKHGDEVHRAWLRAETDLFFENVAAHGIVAMPVKGGE